MQLDHLFNAHIRAQFNAHIQPLDFTCHSADLIDQAKFALQPWQHSTCMLQFSIALRSGLYLFKQRQGSLIIFASLQHPNTPGLAPG